MQSIQCLQQIDGLPVVFVKHSEMVQVTKRRGISGCECQQAFEKRTRLEIDRTQLKQHYRELAYRVDIVRL